MFGTIILLANWGIYSLGLATAGLITTCTFLDYLGSIEAPHNPYINKKHPITI